MWLDYRILGILNSMIIGHFEKALSIHLGIVRVVDGMLFEV